MIVLDTDVVSEIMKPPALRSGQVFAGIAKSRGMAVTTRNAIHFEDCGIDIIDPWSD